MNEEIINIEEDIKKKEKWITKKVQRLDEMEGKMELVNVSLLGGAEREREMLEVLLERRRAILGERVEGRAC